MSLQDLVPSGALEREGLTTGEVQRFQKSIQDRIADASNAENSNSTRMELAYHAVLECAILALRVDGFRLKSVRGHHQIALETLSETIGTTTEVIDYFLELSSLRGAVLCEAAPVSDSDVEDAIAAAIELADKLTGWIKFRINGQ